MSTITHVAWQIDGGDFDGMTDEEQESYPGRYVHHPWWKRLAKELNCYSIDSLAELFEYVTACGGRLTVTVTEREEELS